MTTLAKLPSRFRLRVAVLLLVVTAVFTAVAWSQLFFAAGNDPRDTLGGRAAGLGFTDTAHDTVYAAIPLALPLLAGLLAARGVVHLVAAVEYGVLIATGALISGAAFIFGLDAAEQQRAGFTTVFIDTRSAVESLLLDLAVLALAATAMTVSLRAWARGRADLTGPTRMHYCASWSGVHTRWVSAGNLCPISEMARKTRMTRV